MRPRLTHISRAEIYFLAVAATAPFLLAGAVLAQQSQSEPSSPVPVTPPATAGSQAAPANGGDQCRLVVEDAVKRVSGHLDRCELEISEQTRTIAALRAQINAGTPGAGAPPWVGEVPARLGELTRKLRPDADPAADPAQELTRIIADVEAALEERNRLRLALSSAEAKLAEQESRAKEANSKKLRAFEAELAGLSCSILEVSGRDGGEITVSGLIESDAALRALQAKAKEAEPEFAIKFERVSSLGKGACIRRINEEWALVREANAQPGEYEIEKGPAVTNARDRLPESLEACFNAASRLLANGQIVRELQLKPDINVEVWMQRGQGIGLCQSKKPEDQRSWRSPPTVPDGTFAMMLIKLKP